MNKNRNTFFSAGISSILLVFVLLCLITFAVLSLTSADTDYKLSKKTAERTTLYYTAQMSAAKIVKDIDGLLLEQYNKSRNCDEFEENILKISAGEQNYQAEKTDEGIRIYFTQSIDEEEMLEAELTVCYPQKEGESLYRIEKWQSVQNADWQPDTTLPVMQQPG